MSDPKSQVDENDKQKLMFDIESIEQKVVWELETWRNNEEAKFKIQIKQKEYDLLQTLQTEQKAKEFERERAFKQQIAQIQLIEQKMKQKVLDQINVKCLDLQRREQRIVQMEEELKIKLSETARVIKDKDDEQGRLIKKFKDEKLQYEKDKTLTQLKTTDSQGTIQKLQDEVKRLLKEMENSPIAIVKGDLMKKVQEINDLKKEIDKINQIKEQYKQYYEKVRDELVRQKKVNEELQQVNQSQSHSEMQKIKDSLEELKKSQQLKQDEKRIKQERQNVSDLQINPFKQGMFDNSENNRDLLNQQSIPQSLHKPNPMKQVQNKPYPNGENMSDLQRILQERAYLIESGEYQEDDPLIYELTRHIQELGGN